MPCVLGTLEAGLDRPTYRQEVNTLAVRFGNVRGRLGQTDLSPGAGRDHQRGRRHSCYPANSRILQRVKPKPAKAGTCSYQRLHTGMVSTTCQPQSLTLCQLETGFVRLLVDAVSSATPGTFIITNNFRWSSHGHHGSKRRELPQHAQPHGSHALTYVVRSVSSAISFQCLLGLFVFS